MTGQQKMALASKLLCLGREHEISHTIRTFMAAMSGEPAADLRAQPCGNLTTLPDRETTLELAVSVKEVPPFVNDPYRRLAGMSSASSPFSTTSDELHFSD